MFRINDEILEDAGNACGFFLLKLHFYIKKIFDFKN